MSLTNATPVEVAQSARFGSRRLAVLSNQARNDALTAIHAALAAAKEEILEANARDLAAASKAADDGTLSQSLVKRLDLGKKGKYEDMLQGILDVRELEDPRKLPFLDVHPVPLRTFGSSNTKTSEVVPLFSSLESDLVSLLLSSSTCPLEL